MNYSVNVTVLHVTVLHHVIIFIQDWIAYRLIFYWYGVFLALNKQLKPLSALSPALRFLSVLSPVIPAWSAPPPSPCSAVILMNRTAPFFLGQNWAEKTSIDQLQKVLLGSSLSLVSLGCGPAGFFIPA